jgi:hypothetical protein
VDAFFPVLSVRSLDQRFMRWSIGYVHWPAHPELFTQHRDDFFAEQIELLKHRLQRQPGVIDQNNCR